MPRFANSSHPDFPVTTTIAPPWLPSTARSASRSLLAYELPDGRLKLIDGHLRRDLDPDMEVEVELLYVTEDKARTLLLSIDRSPRSPRRNSSCAAGCRNWSEVPEDLRLAWEATARAAIESPP